MQREQIRKIETFNSSFVKTKNGDSYVRFDFGDFYEWFVYKTRSTFTVLDEKQSEIMEQAFIEYQAINHNKIIYLNNPDKKTHRHP